MSMPDLPSQARPLSIELSSEGLGYLVMRVDASIQQRLTRATRSAFGVTGRQSMVMMLLADRPGMTVMELASALDIDTGATTRMLNRIAGLGLVSRTRRDDDHRVVRVALTRAGQARVAVMPMLVRDVLGDMLAGLTPDEIDGLTRLLQRIRMNSGGSRLGIQPVDAADS